MIDKKVFIGSSSEGLEIAKTLMELLKNDLNTFLWSQNIFDPSSYPLKSLHETLLTVNFGIFVITPDDFLETRNNSYKVARDNVIFELGLFMGKLGYENCFIVIPRNIDRLHLPSDLLGLTVIDYDNKSGKRNLKFTLKYVREKILHVILKRTLEAHIQPAKKKSSIQLADFFWINEKGEEIIKRKEKGYKNYLIVFDLIGFESMNKKYGELLCNKVLMNIEDLIKNTFKNEHHRIGDTFLFFKKYRNDDEVLLNTLKIKNAIMEYDWGTLSSGLYINVSTSICRHEVYEDVWSWLQRAIMHMRYVKKYQSVELTIAPLKIKEDNYTIKKDLDYDIS